METTSDEHPKRSAEKKTASDEHLDGVPGKVTTTGTSASTECQVREDYIDEHLDGVPGKETTRGTSTLTECQEKRRLVTSISMKC